MERRKIFLFENYILLYLGKLSKVKSNCILSIRIYFWENTDTKVTVLIIAQRFNNFFNGTCDLLLSHIQRYI